MLEDVESHRPTEIDLITGALVREADRHGVDVPLHTALYRLVKAKEESWLPLPQDIVHPEGARGNFGGALLARGGRRRCRCGRRRRAAHPSRS